jgi:hypothetical protein
VSPSSSTSSSEPAAEGGAAARRWFLGTLLPIAAALGAVFAWNYVLDPFGMNGRFSLGLDRAGVSQTLNYRLYKTIEFTRAPRAAIVLGDSRCDLLRSEFFARAGRPDVYNLSFGGGKLVEAIDAFWFADARTALREVWFCVPFSIYNGAATPANGVPEALALQRPRMGYYLSPFVAKAGFELLYARVTGRLLHPEKPPLSREAFWARQLGPEVAGQLARWRPPSALDAKLAEIAAHCRARGIALTFVIPPDHVDLQAKIDAFGLREPYEAMKRRLAELAPVIDLDRPNAFTANADNYLDPYHPTPVAAEAVVREIVERTASGVSPAPPPGTN